ncbi:MAG: winged helix-turn-helix transcriptional regulator [Candidatus Odinarchaeota archaeon]
MDWLDKALLWELFGNARVSYQDLARKYELSFNAIKNRVKKLKEVGAIQEYTVELSLAMLGLEPINISIETDGSETIKSLIDQIGKLKPIRMVTRFGNRLYSAFAFVAGTADFFELKMNLESLKSVTKVTIHPMLTIAPYAPPKSKARSRGQKIVFTQNQLRVLKCLTEDVRMPIGEIAKKTSLTSRRISKILRELQEGGGVHFTIRMNYMALGDINLELVIRYDETNTGLNEIVKWFQEHYPNEFWTAGQMLDEPTVGISLLVEDPTQVGEITNIVRETTFSESVDDYMITSQSYVKLHYRDPSQHHLEELFKEAGL